MFLPELRRHNDLSCPQELRNIGAAQDVIAWDHMAKCKISKWQIERQQEQTDAMKKSVMNCVKMVIDQLCAQWFQARGQRIWTVANTVVKNVPTTKLKDIAHWRIVSLCGHAETTTDDGWFTCQQKNDWNGHFVTPEHESAIGRQSLLMNMMPNWHGTTGGGRPHIGHRCWLQLLLLDCSLSAPPATHHLLTTRDVSLPWLCLKVHNSGLFAHFAMRPLPMSLLCHSWAALGSATSLVPVCMKNRLERLVRCEAKQRSGFCLNSFTSKVSTTGNCADRYDNSAGQAPQWCSQPKPFWQHFLFLDFCLNLISFCADFGLFTDMNIFCNISILLSQPSTQSLICAVHSKEKSSSTESVGLVAACFCSSKLSLFISSVLWILSCEKWLFSIFACLPQWMQMQLALLARSCTFCQAQALSWHFWSVCCVRGFWNLFFEMTWSCPTTAVLTATSDRGQMRPLIVPVIVLLSSFGHKHHHHCLCQKGVAFASWSCQWVLDGKCGWIVQNNWLDKKHGAMSLQSNGWLQRMWGMVRCMSAAVIKSEEEFQKKAHPPHKWQMTSTNCSEPQPVVDRITTFFCHVRTSFLANTFA